MGRKAARNMWSRNTNKIGIQCICWFYSQGISYDARTYDLKKKVSKAVLRLLSSAILSAHVKFIIHKITTLRIPVCVCVCVCNVDNETTGRA